MWKILNFPKKFQFKFEKFYAKFKNLGMVRVFFSFFPSSYVTKNDSFFKMSFFTKFYFIIHKIYRNFWILNQVKNLQMCISGVVTHLVGLFSVDLPIYPTQNKYVTHPIKSLREPPIPYQQSLPRNSPIAHSQKILKTSHNPTYESTIN
jgi:hypothetical protein